MAEGRSSQWPQVIADGRMLRQSIPGLAKPASPLALGFEDFRSLAEAAPLLDAFHEAGGNVFDTAFVYGGGVTEKLLGEWFNAHGVRDDCVIIGKGAHTPECRPEAIGRQLEQTLDRLRTDHVDVYFMHRDDPSVPVDEFVDAMNEEVRASLITGPFGGSNWTLERMEGAIAYAERSGKQSPGALSNNLALARMVEPVWPGCVSASGPEWKEWLIARQVPVFAWSSQARGFFTERAGRDRRDDAELARCWYSEGNFERRDRAVSLAEKLGRRPIHVALAYVLAQPFPVVPLVGPRTPAELADSLNALDMVLEPDETAWLEEG